MLREMDKMSFVCALWIQVFEEVINDDTILMQLIR